MRKKIFLLLTILWMAVIFWFSSRNADLSTEDSTRIGRAIAGILAKGFDGWDEYGLLGILASGIFAEYRMRPGKWMRRALLTGMLYACFDEIHQSFTPGRSCQFSDVILDSCGVLAGVLLALLFLWMMPVWKTFLYRMGFGG